MYLNGLNSSILDLRQAKTKSPRQSWRQETVPWREPWLGRWIARGLKTQSTKDASQNPLTLVLSPKGPRKWRRRPGLSLLHLLHVACNSLAPNLTPRNIGF